jgi:hypothetical protein
VEVLPTAKLSLANPSRGANIGLILRGYAPQKYEWGEFQQYPVGLPQGPLLNIKIG